VLGEKKSARQDVNISFDFLIIPYLMKI